MLLSLSSCVLLLAAVLAADTEQAVLSGATRPSLRDKRLVQLSQDPLNVQWMSFEDRFALKNDDGFYKDVFVGLNVSGVFLMLGMQNELS